MRRVLLLALAILALAVAAAAAAIWSNDLILSIYGYRSPMRGDLPLTEGSSNPLASQVVLVLVDGLRYDTSLQMPYLHLLRQQAAHAVLHSSPPSSAQTAWTTIVSGAVPEINDAPLFDHSTEWIAPIAVDDLFAVANRSGLTGGIAGSQAWSKLVPSNSLYTQFFADPTDPASDRRVTENALVFLNEFKPNFLLVHLVQVDAAGRQHGAASAEYGQAAVQCDEEIRRLAEQMDLRRSVLLVTSSYGYLDSGGRGGEEAVLLRTPFVMAGRNVLPGDYGEIRAVDLAPTVAALLGTPVPSSAQGRIQTSMLTMDAVDRAEKLVLLATQRVRLGSMYLYSIGQGQLQETAQGDMLVAVSSLQVKNYESAAELAALSVEQTDREMLQARRARVWGERTQRGIPLSLLVVILTWALWRNRSTRELWSMLAAGMAATLYHVLLVQEGRLYSFSDLPAEGLAATLEPSLQRAILSLGAGAMIVTWRAWREKERSAFDVLMRAYGYAGLLLALIAVAIGVFAWYNGPRFDWHLPSFAIAYVQFVALIQAMLTAAIAIPMPFAVVALQRILLAITDRYA